MNHSQLAACVQHNCHITDANHGGNFTLCIYLLKMREYFRWEQGYDMATVIKKTAIGDWLTEREALWESLEDQGYQSIELDGEQFDAFDDTAINQRLESHGLIYSAGLGQGNTPHFFLGELLHSETQDGFRLRISGRELARDLASPPAMSRDGEIYIRRESLRRMLWERVDGWNWSKPKNAMSRAIANYPVEDDIDSALDQMTDDQIEAIVLHEIGEVRAGEILGDGWQEMLVTLPMTRAELVCRSIRDNLADCLVTLPGLLENNDVGSLHFYMANLSNMRKALFPSLERAYEDWLRTDNSSELSLLFDTAANHWQTVACQLMELHREKGATASREIAACAELNPL